MAEVYVGGGELHVV